MAGVALGIGAVLTLTSAPDDGNGQGPTVAQPAVTTTTAPAPSTPSPTIVPTVVTPTARPTPSRAPSAIPSAATPSATPSPTAAVRPPLTVLNNSRISKLADRAAAQFRRGGWTIAETGNYNRSELSLSTVYYATGQKAAAQRLARAYGIPRVLPRIAGLPGSGLTVVLTRDYDV